MYKIHDLVSRILYDENIAWQDFIDSLMIVLSYVKYTGKTC